MKQPAVLFDTNKYELTKKRFYYDLTVLGIGCVKNTFSTSEGVKIEYVDPANLVYSYTESPYFEDIYYAGVLYLSKGHDSTPGTIFYKQNSTKLDRAVSEEHIADITIHKEYNKVNKWTAHTISNLVYNRLIIYPASKFHGPGPGFGTTDETARLVQLFYWIDIK